MMDLSIAIEERLKTMAIEDNLLGKFKNPAMDLR
jgi:hypothetical protein